MTPDRIVVTGQAERHVQADVAELALTVVELDADQRAAFARCAERVEDLLPRLRQAAGEGGIVTTGNLALERDWSSEHGPVRYAASCPVSVECAVEVAPRVVSEAIASGVERLQGPSYRVRDPGPVTDDLLAEAVDDARRKASRLAARAQRELGAALVIKEGSPSRVIALASRASAGGDIDLHPAALTLHVALRVTYALT